MLKALRNLKHNSWDARHLQPDMKFTFITFLIFLRLIHLCSGQMVINTNCRYGRILVREDDPFDITCQHTYHYTPVTWMLHYANGSNAEIGTCRNSTCTTIMIGANLTSNIAASKLHFLRIDRSMDNGVLQCSLGTGIQKTNCTLKVEYHAVLKDCSIWNNSENKSVSGFCRVPKVYSSSNRYTCRWFERTNEIEQYQVIANGTVSLTPFNDSSGLLYHQGNCSMIKTNFSLMQNSTYTADFTPGTGHVAVAVNNSTTAWVSHTVPGMARSGLSTIYSTTNDIVSKASDGPALSDSSFLIWCIIGVTFTVIVISSAVIIIKCRRRTSKKSDGEINYENDVIVNLTGPHIATSIPIQEKTGKNRTGDEVTSAGGDYEAMIDNDTYAPTDNGSELTSDLNTNLTRHDSNDTQTPVSCGDVYAVVNKTSDTSDVGGDVYAVANKSREKTSNTITDVCAGANGANEKGSDVGGDVYAVVNKCSEKMTSGAGGDVYAVVNKCSEKMTSGAGGDVYAVVDKTLKGSQ